VVTDVEPRFHHTSLLSPAELVLWRRFIETHAAIVRNLDEDLRAQSGLTLSSFEVLYQLVLATDNRLRMAELADLLLFTRSGVTRLVDRLERGGFVERNDCAHDGRGVYAILTQKGFDTFEAAAAPHIDGVRRLFFDRLDGSDDVLRRLLLQLAPDRDAKSPA
jgi:DNA-binding MarR family transcriptional regulator